MKPSFSKISRPRFDNKLNILIRNFCTEIMTDRLFDYDYDTACLQLIHYTSTHSSLYLNSCR